MDDDLWLWIIESSKPEDVADELCKIVDKFHNRFDHYPDIIQLNPSLVKVLNINGSFEGMEIKESEELYGKMVALYPVVLKRTPVIVDVVRKPVDD